MATDNSYRIVIQRLTATSVPNQYTFGAFIWETGAANGIRVPMGVGTVSHTFDEPQVLGDHEYFAVYVVRLDSTATAEAIIDVGATTSGNFSDFTGYTRDISLLTNFRISRGTRSGIPDGQDHTFSDTQAYRQEITYDIPLGGGDLDAYSGTVVTPNAVLPDPSFATLDTVTIDGTNFLVTPEHEEGEVTLRTNYAISESPTGAHDGTYETYGNLFHAGSHDFRIREVRMAVESVLESDYVPLILHLNRVSATEYYVTERDTAPGLFRGSAGVVSEFEIEWNEEGIFISSDSFFAIVLYNGSQNEGARVRRRSTPPVNDSFDDVIAFNFLELASFPTDPISASNVYDTGGYAAFMEVAVDIEVPRVVDIELEGVHIVSAPEALNFTGPLVNIEPDRTTRKADIAIGVPERLNEFYSGINYLTLVAGGTGYTSAPTVVIPGSSGATATATVDSGSVVALQLTNRGTGLPSAPLLTFTGGGGTGALAEATLWQYSRITQDFVNANADSRFASATFDLARALVEADRDKFCYPSFDVGAALETIIDNVRAYVRRSRLAICWICRPSRLQTLRLAANFQIQTYPRCIGILLALTILPLCQTPPTERMGCGLLK